MSDTGGTAKVKKAWYKKWWVWVLGILLLAAIANAGSRGPTAAPTTAPSTNAAAPAASTATTPEASAPAEQVPAEPAATPKWTEVARLSGSNNKRGSSFHLTGADARLTYKVTGKTSLICGIYVVDKGTSLKDTGGFPEAMVSKAGSDSTMLSQGEGDYYLDVTAANCTWSVTIEELR